ncbi:uncharacterized protein LOC126852251 [Cataglyphis hispanica]|uniref:uncharacterized protein LOC126852251 n=1 Tax=Cataglyphis hispanica TaxID=1086592 RepID=UPI00217FE0FC|nr:uncharacterized protein LOC126852251 [Cataglyphis hispanica]XP_050452809.1 uncharacterized protein LOC126852251 [Cataglyphis hispanica]
MNNITSNFTWTRQLECPPTVYNDSMKKILCKGVLEFVWEDISNSTFPVAETCKIRKNILLYKLKHGLNDSTITSIKHLNQLKAKSNTLKQQISTLEDEYEERDYVVRQKMQRLKDIKDMRSMISTRKDILKLKHDETSKQLKDCGVMRQVCQRLMPNTSKDISQQKLRENLDTIAGLRSTTNKKKQIWEKISNSLGNIDIHTLWTHLYQALSQDLDKLMKLEIKNDPNSSTVVSENIDIGIARACGQNICMISKRILSNAKVKIYQQRLMEFIELIESLSHKDVNIWLALILEVKKLEAEQVYLQNEVQGLKNNIQDNFSLNHDIAQLTTDIQTVDAQMDGYIKGIQQSLAIFNSAPSLILKAKEKLHYELQKIVALQSDDYPKCLNNALDIELDMFYNNLDLNALRKVILKGDVGLYRHAICNLNKASITTINPQWRIKTYFPMIQMPIYCLIECYRNAIANIIYTKLHSLASIKDIDQCSNRLVSREKCDYNSLELLSFSKVVCDQACEEIEHFNAILRAWAYQEVQEAMALVETTVDNVLFKDWLQRYSLLLYMIQNGK